MFRYYALLNQKFYVGAQIVWNWVQPTTCAWVTTKNSLYAQPHTFKHTKTLYGNDCVSGTSWLENAHIRQNF